VATVAAKVLVVKAVVVVGFLAMDFLDKAPAAKRLLTEVMAAAAVPLAVSAVVAVSKQIKLAAVVVGIVAAEIPMAEVNGAAAAAAAHLTMVPASQAVYLIIPVLVLLLLLNYDVDSINSTNFK
jgi:hypothetical protein